MLKVLSNIKIVFMCTLFVFGNLRGEIYYLSPNGSDSGNGSINSPWFSLDYALNKYANDNVNSRVGPGDLLLLRGGVYDVTRMSRAAATNKSCPYFLPNTNAGSARILIKSYPGEWAIFDGGNEMSMIGTNIDIYNVDFDSFEVRNCRTVGIMLGEGWGSRYLTNCTFRHLYLHDNTDPSVNNNPSGMWLSGVDCIVEFCTFSENGTPGESHHNSTNLLLFGNYNDWPESKPTRNITVRYNKFIGSACGVKDKGDGNFVNHNNPDENHPEYFSEIYYNIFEGARNNGVYADQDFEKVHHNLFINCSGGVFIHGQLDRDYKTTWYIQIYNNTFINTQDIDIYVRHSSIVAGVGYHHEIYNNILYNFRGDYAVNFYSGQSKTWPMSADHNAYDNTSSTITRYADRGNLTLFQWQQSGFGDESFQEAINLNDNYSLPTGSNCLGAGRNGVDLGAISGNDWTSMVGHGQTGNYTPPDLPRGIQRPQN